MAMTQTEREALVALYNATDGPNWKENGNWNTDVDLSQWHGIATDDQGRVVSILLENHNLQGPIPEEVGKLTALKKLHLGGNKLSELPRATAEGFKAIGLGIGPLEGNPWEAPPWRVIQGGWDQVISFYDALSQSGGEVVPSVKLVLIGAVCAGKTTLTRGLLDGHLAEELPSRTRGVDVHIEPWVPDFTPPLEVTIWDFAGHDDYYSTHQLFLTDGALHLLVVDLHKFDRDPLSRVDAAYIWLDSLLCRVPESVVLVVGTHVDAFGDDLERSAAALRNLEIAITEHLETKRKEWERVRKQIERRRNSHAQPVSTRRDFVWHSKSDPPSLRLCGFAAVSGRSMDDVTTLGKTIWEVANDRTMFPDVRQVIPNVWRRVWAVMDALHVGADPDSAVRLEGAPVPIEGRARQEFVTEEYGLEAWRAADRESAAEMSDSQGDSEQLSDALSKQFKAALELRSRGGAVLTACGLIHLNPSWINGLLRELLDHRLADPKKAHWWREQLGAYSDEHGIWFDELIEIHSRFAPTGLLTTEYLGFLWRDIVKDPDRVVFGRLVNTMAAHDAMFPCGDRVVEGGAGEFMVPARLPSSVAESSLAKLQDAVSTGTRMQFVIEIYAEYVPPAIIAQFLGAFGRSGDGCLRFLVIHTCWTRGVSFEAAGRECLIRVGENLAPSEGAEASSESRPIVEINVGGPGKDKVFEVGFEIKEKMQKLLRERYPGLQFNASMHPTYMSGPDAWQDSLNALQRDLLEKIDENLKDVLQRILGSFGAQSTVVDEALTKRLSSLRSDMQHDVSLQLDSHAEEVVVGVDERVRESLSKMNLGSDASSSTERRVLTSVAGNVAFLRWPIPRLVCVLPIPESTLQESDRAFDQWSAVLKKWCRGGKEKGKRWGTRELRVFFLCSYDMSLAECGPGGQGYKVKELLEWAKKAKPLAKVGLALASIALKVCTGLAVPTADFEAAFGTKAGGALSGFVTEALHSGIEKMTSVAGERLGGGGPAGEPRIQNGRPTPLQGFAYDQLKEVVRSFECETFKAKPPFPSFDTAMQLVDRGGRGEEWAWVRTRRVLLGPHRAAPMADVAVVILRVVAKIRDVAQGIKENDRQARRLFKRVLAVEPPVLAVREGTKLSSSEALRQLLATVEKIRNFLRGYAQTPKFNRALKRKANADKFTELGIILTEGMQALQLDVAVDAWAKEDASDRLADLENMVDMMERMERSRTDNHAEVMSVLKALRNDERAELKGWVEIDYDTDLDFEGSTILGSGAFGEVRTAKWNGVDVAVKHLLVHGLHANTVRALRKEIRLHSSLNFVHVVQLYAASTVPPHLCLVIELAEGGSLQDYLYSTPEPLEHALQTAFLFDIASGMSFLHSKGILHRDLKSANVLMFANRRLKLCDFGLSKVKSESSSRSKRGAVGTAQWMSPEEMDESPSNELTDVYSFGIVCFEVATRMEPFKGLKQTQVTRAVADKGKRPQIPEEASASPDVVALMEKCWKQDPADRPEGFGPVVQALADVVRRVGDPRVGGQEPRTVNGGVDASSSWSDPASQAAGVSPVTSQACAFAEAGSGREGIALEGGTARRAAEDAVVSRERSMHAPFADLPVANEGLPSSSGASSGRFKQLGKMFGQKLSMKDKSEEEGRLQKPPMAGGGTMSDSDDLKVAMDLRKRADSLQRQGNYAEATPLYPRAAEIQEKILGPDHQDVATTLNNWAGLLESQVRT
eukprot:g8755.t1